MVCLLLALLIAVSYFHVQAIFLNWSATLLKGCLAAAIICGHRRCCWLPASCSSTTAARCGCG